MLNAMQIYYILEIGLVLNNTLAKFITFSENDCGYSGSAHDIMVNWVHPFFLKDKYSAGKKDNKNWRQEMNGTFADKYSKAACREIEMLEGTEAWKVVDRTEEINVIDQTRDLKLKQFPDGLIKISRCFM